MSAYGKTKTTLTAHKLQPKKKFGQNFLVHRQTAETIAHVAGVESTDTIFEVGVGKINATMNMTKIILQEKPTVVINFGSCGNLKNWKPGGLLELCEIYNDFDTQGLIPNPPIIFRSGPIKCMTTDTIYDNSHSNYSNTYKELLKECSIVDMEAYALAYVCQQHGVEYRGFKWVTDDGSPDTWEENASSGYEPFKELFNERICKKYFEL